MVRKTLQRESRRRILKTAAGATAALALGSGPLSRIARAQAKTVYVNTWGGSWTAAEETAYFKPFTQATGIQIRTVAPVSFAKLKAQVQSGQYEWDVSGLGVVEYTQAVHENLLEPVDFSVICQFALKAVPHFALNVSPPRTRIWRGRTWGGTVARRRCAEPLA